MSFKVDNNFCSLFSSNSFLTPLGKSIYLNSPHTEGESLNSSKIVLIKPEYVETIQLAARAEAESREKFSQTSTCGRKLLRPTTKYKL